jgi:predicted small secreted protein
MPRTRTATNAILPAAALLLAACNTNPFLAGYGGERLAPVAAASVVAEDPAPDAARQLGRSRFIASARHADLDAEALEAARAVGADLVRWQARQLTREEWVESDPVYERRASGRGQFASYIPIPGTRDRWEYSARFWSTVTAPAAVTPAAATPASPGQAPAPAASPPAPSPRS